MMAEQLASADRAAFTVFQVYVSGFPPFDAETGEIIARPIEQQAEIVLRQMKLCLETAGSSLDQVLKCNVYWHGRWHPIS